LVPLSYSDGDHPHLHSFPTRRSSDLGRWGSHTSRSNASMSSPNAVDDLPNIDPVRLQPIDIDTLAHPDDPRHPPRILVLYGSLRERSFSRLVSGEADRLPRSYGCEARTFNPSGLPLPDG